MNISSNIDKTIIDQLCNDVKDQVITEIVSIN